MKRDTKHYKKRIKQRKQDAFKSQKHKMEKVDLYNIIIDTSTVLRYPNLIKKINTMGYCKLIITSGVYFQIHKHSVKNENARNFLYFLKRFKNKVIFYETIIENVPVYEDVADLEILAATKKYKNPIIITSDMGIVLRAKIRCIPIIYYAIENNKIYLTENYVKDFLAEYLIVDSLTLYKYKLKFLKEELSSRILILTKNSVEQLLEKKAHHRIYAKKLLKKIACNEIDIIFVDSKYTDETEEILHLVNNFTMVCTSDKNLYKAIESKNFGHIVKYIE